jgi:hypothetical protein
LEPAGDLESPSARAALRREVSIVATRFRVAAGRAVVDLAISIPLLPSVDSEPVRLDDHELAAGGAGCPPLIGLR